MDIVTATPAERGTTFHPLLASKPQACIGHDNLPHMSCIGSLHSVYDFLLDRYTWGPSLSVIKLSSPAIFPDLPQAPTVNNRVVRVRWQAYVLFDSCQRTAMSRSLR